MNRKSLYSKHVGYKDLHKCVAQCLILSKYLLNKLINFLTSKKMSKFTKFSLQISTPLFSLLLTPMTSSYTTLSFSDLTLCVGGSQNQPQVNDSLGLAEFSTQLYSQLNILQQKDTKQKQQREKAHGTKSRGNQEQACKSFFSVRHTGCA